MGVSGNFPLTTYRKLMPGVYLCRAEGVVTGDASGGNMTFVATTPAQKSGDWWLGLWASIVATGAASVKVIIQRTGTLYQSPTAVGTDAMSFTTTATDGYVPQEAILAVRVFLRKPYRNRQSPGFGYTFYAPNVTPGDLTVELWALQVIENEADWSELIKILIAL